MLLIDIVSIVVIIKLSKGLGQDEILERLKIGCSVAVFLLGMLLVYYIAYLLWKGDMGKFEKSYVAIIKYNH